MSTAHIPTAVSPNRVTEIDGLRGLFAFLVYVFHAVGGLVLSSKANPVWFDFLMRKTPLEFFQSGWQYVLGFFLLSGFALTLPLRSGKRVMNWWAYYPSRLVRLYLPVVASILLAACWICLFMRTYQPVDSGWLRFNRVAHLGPNYFYEAFLLEQYPRQTHLNGVLWSLRWEVVGSMLLPIFYLGLHAGQRYLRRWHELIILGGGVLLAAYYGLWGVFYLITFLIGMWLALHRQAFIDVFNHLRQQLGGKIYAFFGLTGFGLLYWYSNHGVGEPIGNLYDPTSTAKALAGIIGSVIILGFCLTPGAIHTFFKRRLLQFLGRISFSLYLTHLPVLLTLDLLCENWAPGWILLISLPTCMMVAELFYLLIEKPSHRLSKQVYRNVVAKLRPKSVRL